MRLIDADKQKKYIDDQDGRPFIGVTIGEAFKIMVDEQPTIEPKRGKWIPHKELSREYIGTVLVNVSYDYWFCNTCGYRVEKGQPMYNFCPNCGADMRG